MVDDRRGYRTVAGAAALWESTRRALGEASATRDLQTDRRPYGSGFSRCSKCRMFPSAINPPGGAILHLTAQVT